MLCVVPDAYFSYRWHVVGNYGEQIVLLRSLVARKGPDCVARLEELADRSSRFECVLIAESLLSLGKAIGRPAVLRLLTSDNPEARYGAASALRITGDPLDLERLQLLADDPDPGVQLVVLDGLVSFGRLEYVPRIIDLTLSSDGNSAAAAQNTLGYFFHPQGPVVPWEKGSRVAHELWSEWWAIHKMSPPQTRRREPCPWPEEAGRVAK